MAQKPATPDSEDAQTADEIVEQLRRGGDLHALTQGQAEAFARRDVLDQSRAETAEALDISMSAVDNRLRGARDNIESAADLVRSAHALGAYDDGRAAEVLDELRAEIEVEDDRVDDEDRDRAGTADEEILSRLDQLSERVEELSSQQERRQAAPERREGDESQTTDETPDRSARLWGRLMDRCSVSSLTRSDGAVAVTVDDDHVDAAEEILVEIGYAIWTTSDAGDSKTKIRARGQADEEPEPEVEDDEEQDDRVDDEDRDLDEPEDDDLYRCESCGATFETGAALGGHSSSCSEREQDEHECRGCGATFATGAALGGHRKSCDEIDQE